MLLHHVKFTVHGEIAKRNEMKNVNYVKCVFKVGVRCSFKIQKMKWKVSEITKERIVTKNFFGRLYFAYFRFLSKFYSFLNQNAIFIYTIFNEKKKKEKKNTHFSFKITQYVSLHLSVEKIGTKLRKVSRVLWF